MISNDIYEVQRCYLIFCYHKYLDFCSTLLNLKFSPLIYIKNHKVSKNSKCSTTLMIHKICISPLLPSIIPIEQSSLQILIISSLQ